MKNSILVLLVYFCFGNSILIASDIVVNDVFSNKEYNFLSKYKEVHAVQLSLEVEVGVSYFGFDSSNSKVQSTINKSIIKLALNDWTTENGMQSIRNELKQRVVNYMELLNSSRKYRRDYYGRNFEYASSIKSIECKPISIYNHNLIFALNYEFDLKSNQDYFNDELVISHYYKVDLLTGEVVQIINKLNQSQLELISKRLSKKFNDKYLLKTAKLSQQELTDYNDEDDDVDGINLLNKDGVVCKDVCEKIDFKEADFIWYGWGVSINFQNYTRSSNLYNGSAFGLFLPFNECSLINDVLQDYKFTNSLKLPKTSLSNFNYYSLVDKFSDLNTIQPIEKLVISNNIQKLKVKTLNVESYQLFDNDRKNFRGMFSYEFDTLGNLLSKSYANEKSKPINLDVYTYTRQGFLESRINKDIKTAEYYNYDKEGNLFEKRTQDKYGASDIMFFYNGEYIYMIEENSRDFIFKDNIKKIKVGKDELCLWNSCYILDNQKRPMGIKSTINRYEQFQIGHDEKGRVVETHRDFDRYHNYFNYDSLDRFVSFQTYDSQNPTMVIEYFYNENDTHPFKQIKRSIQSGTVEMEKYNYEYF